VVSSIVSVADGDNPDTVFKVEAYEGYVHLHVDTTELGSLTVTISQARALATTLEHYTGNDSW
jgi:hypothetical protein